MADKEAIDDGFAVGVGEDGVTEDGGGVEGGGGGEGDFDGVEVFEDGAVFGDVVGLVAEGEFGV